LGRSATKKKYNIICGGQEVHTGIRWGDGMERGDMEDLGVDGRRV
jgi:hypothetical protein